MPHDKRVCRRKSRIAGLNRDKNYFSKRAYQRALKKKLMAKLSRKRNRK